MEEWRAVVGYEGLYEVSSLGNVRRISTRGGRLIPLPRNRKLVPRNGYLQVMLSKDGKVVLAWVHRLVALAFLPFDPARREVNHIDGDRSRNCVSNLEWVTHAENGKHAYRIGLKIAAPNPGESNGNALLTTDVVRQMREMARTLTVREISDQLGLPYTTVWGVVRRVSWRHVA